MLSSFLVDYYAYFMENNLLEDFLRDGDNVKDKKEKLYIKNIYDYLKIIDLFETERRQDRYNLSKNFLYRGIANKEWKLEPSLGFNNLVGYEKRMITEFRQLRPDEFLNMDDFNTISKMQHYGLPTRLLDFTMNPLVALYFACNDKERYNVDGKIYFVLPHNGDNLDKYIKRMCSIYKNTEINLIRNLKYFYTYIQLVYGINNFFFVRPNYITEREKRQESIFLLFANDLYDYDKEKIITDEEGYRLYTDNNAEIPTYVKYANSLHDLNNVDIYRNFMEIIIPNDIKENLLYSLEKMGIRKDYLFPELEYTAEFIKNKYINIDLIFQSNKFKNEYEFD